MRGFCIRTILGEYWTNARARSQLEPRGKPKRDYFEKMGSIGGFLSAPTRYEMSKEASLGAALRRLTSMIGNKPKRRSKERTSRYEKKSTKHPCSRRSLGLQKRCERFCCKSRR